LGVSLNILRAVCLYAAFASLWILLSDKALEWLFTTPAQITLASTCKGWVFVAITSVLLYKLMRRIVDSTYETSPIAPVGFLRSLLVPIALVTIAILTLTAGILSHTFQQGLDKEAAQLQAIADIKAQIQILAFGRFDKERERVPLEVSSIVKEASKLLRASLPSSIEIRQNIEPGLGRNESLYECLSCHG
jgi:hypothetical protein